jgi:hypothetical protein
MTEGGHIMRNFARAGGAFALVATFALGPTALAQTTGTIDGTVVNGTEQAPAADIDVSVQLFASQGDLGLLEGTTDAKGRFSFDALPPGVAGYQVIANYGGAEYRGIAQAYTPGVPTNATLTVFEPTIDPGDVTYTDYIVWVDQTEGAFAVQHDLRFANAGTTAYIGQGGEVVTIELPPGATNPQFLGTFLETPGEISGDTYVSSAPIVPGESTATLRFEAPSLPNLSVPLAFPATSFQLYVPQGIDVRSDLLSLEGTITDQGRTYGVYSAQNLAPETVIDAALTQAPADGSQGTAIRILLGVAALVAAGVIVAWFLRRRRASKALAKSPRGAKAAADRPMPREARAEAGAADPAGNGHAVAALDEDAELIIDEIAALDLSFDKGLLDERTYKRLRVAAKDRLLRVQRTRAEGRVR